MSKVISVLEIDRLFNAWNHRLVYSQNNALLCNLSDYPGLDLSL